MAISADDLLQDIPCGFGPDEGLGIRVVMGDVTINRQAPGGWQIPHGSRPRDGRHGKKRMGDGLGEPASRGTSDPASLTEGAGGAGSGRATAHARGRRQGADGRSVKQRLKMAR